MEYIQYVVVKEIEGDTSGLKRSDVVAKADAQNAQLAADIQERFPEVKVVDQLIFGPIIGIPKDRAEEIAIEIRRLFNCGVARGDMPVKVY